MLKVTKIVTGTDVLTLNEVKDFLKIDYTDDDALLSGMIVEARDLIEEYTNRSLIASNIEVVASERDEIKLPYGPVNSITSVVSEETSDALSYTFDGLVLKIKDSSLETILIAYTSLGIVPAGLKLGWKEVVGYLYENREVSILNLLIFNNNIMPYRKKIWI